MAFKEFVITTNLKAGCSALLVGKTPLLKYSSNSRRRNLDWSKNSALTQSGTVFEWVTIEQYYRVSVTHALNSKLHCSVAEKLIGSQNRLTCCLSYEKTNWGLSVIQRWWQLSPLKFQHLIAEPRIEQLKHVLFIETHVSNCFSSLSNHIYSLHKFHT